MIKVYAYIRVSTKKQNINRQIFAMKKLLIPQDNIFIDKESGIIACKLRYKAFAIGTVKEINSGLIDGFLNLVE